MKSHRLLASMMTLCVIWGCASHAQHGEWDDIDYSRVKQRRDYDAGYTAPSVINCVDDDLYNCNK